MELKTYLDILWRRKWILLVTLIMTVGVVTGGTLVMTPTYVTSATLRIEPIVNNLGEPVGWNQIQYTDRLINTYTKIATTHPLLENLEHRLDVNKLPKIEVSVPANTELMEIVIEDEDPTLAANAANILAELLIAEGRNAQTRQTYAVSLVEPATIPEQPAKPKLMINMALGIFVGLIAGLGLSFLFENLDTKLYTTEQIEAATAWSTLGLIPKAGKKQTGFLNGNSPEGEAFIRLRTTLFGSNHQTLPRTLLVTSAEPGEGKSTIVANLAYTIAQSGLSVVAVDGDLRLPTLHKIFNLNNEFGLSNILNQERSLPEVMQDGGLPRVQVLTSGPLPPFPVEALGSPQMTTVIEQLKQQFDLVIIDTPAVLAVSDALVLAMIVDSVVFVVGCAQARLGAVRAAQQQLAALNAKPIGIVINRAAKEKTYNYYRDPITSE